MVWQVVNSAAFITIRSSALLANNMRRHHVMISVRFAIVWYQWTLTQ